MSPILSDTGKYLLVILLAIVGLTLIGQVECQARKPTTPAPYVPPKPDCNAAPKDLGECLLAFKRWSYIKSTGKCERFWWGGCGGEPNRFESPEECERVCRVKKPQPNGRDSSKLRHAAIAQEEPEEANDDEE